MDCHKTFLRAHVVERLAQEADATRGAVRDVLSIGELQHTLAAELARKGRERDLPQLRRLVNLYTFFYRDLPDERLYVPVPLVPVAGSGGHSTDLEHEAAQRLKYLNVCQAARRCGEPIPAAPDFQAYPNLSVLIRTLHARVGEPSSPDHRGIVILAGSGAGKTVASLKAFYDCLFHSRNDTAPGANRAQDEGAALLSEFVPCWLAPSPTLDEASLASYPVAELLPRLILSAVGLPRNERLVKNFSRWLKYGPPLLVFLDLNRVMDDDQLPLAKALFDFQSAWGTRGHRCVVCYRSTQLDAAAMKVLRGPSTVFGFYDQKPLDIRQAVGYLQNWRQYEENIHGELKVDYVERDIDAEVTKLKQLLGAEDGKPPMNRESLLSTPLIMHLYTSLPRDKSAGIESLTDLVRAIVDACLERDLSEYGRRMATAGYDDAALKGAARIAMTRVALAIQALGRDSTRLPAAGLPALLSSPNVDPDTYDRPAWWPTDPFWHRSAYLNRGFPQDDHQRLVEFSLLLRESKLVAFLHDSLIYFFCGADALVDYLGPDNPQLLDDGWCFQVAARLAERPDVWELPTEFLAGRVESIDHQREAAGFPAVLTQKLLCALIIAEVLPPQRAVWLTILKRFAATAQRYAVCARVGEALRLHPSFAVLTDPRASVAQEVANYLRGYEADPRGPCHQFAQGIDP